MQRAYKGASFEIEISIDLASIEGVRLIQGLEIYSGALGRNTQIDRLLLSPWGIICLEAKAFRDALHGTINENTWRGVTGRSVTQIYNPIMQNFEHIRSLNNIFYKRTKQYLSIQNVVVVPDSCRIGTPNRFVMNKSELRSDLLHRTFKKPVLTGLDELERIIKRLVFV